VSWKTKWLYWPSASLQKTFLLFDLYLFRSGITTIFDFYYKTLSIIILYKQGRTL